MTLSRAILGVAAAAFSTMLSVDPRASPPATPARPRATVPVLEAGQEGSAAADLPLATIDGPAPTDLAVNVEHESGGGYRVVLRRPGHVVALLHGATRIAGLDWTSMHVAAPEAAAREHVDRVVWETTRKESLLVARGVLSLRLSGTDLHADLRPAAPPESIAVASGPNHTCAGHRDGAGGFVVLCAITGATRVSAANVTGPRALDDVAVFPGKRTIVRLDLPLAPGIAEARVLGFVAGTVGSVIRAEASWPEGERSTLLLQATSRTQVVSPDSGVFRWR